MLNRIFKSIGPNKRWDAGDDDLEGAIARISLRNPEFPSEFQSAVEWIQRDNARYMKDNNCEIENTQTACEQRLRQLAVRLKLSSGGEYDFAQALENVVEKLAAKAPSAEPASPRQPQTAPPPRRLRLG